MDRGNDLDRGLATVYATSLPVTQALVGDSPAVEDIHVDDRDEQ
jgi:hypothetical protein